MLPDNPDQGAGARNDARPEPHRRPQWLEREKPDAFTERRRAAIMAKLLGLAEPHERPAILATMRGPSL